MLTTPPIRDEAPISDFLYPDSVVRADPLFDLELGALAVGDPSGGLRQVTWEGWFHDGALFVRRRPDGVVEQVLDGLGLVTELGLTFDANMRPHFAYVEDGTAKFYWYDTQQASNVVTSYPGATSPRLCLDDKRDRQSANRDVLLYYLTNGNLCARQQRDRYGVEYVLMATSAVRISRVGMSTGNRVRVELSDH